MLSAFCIDTMKILAVDQMCDSQSFSGKIGKYSLPCAKVSDELAAYMATVNAAFSQQCDKFSGSDKSSKNESSRKTSAA
jgi:hypothetical protein